MPELTPKLTYSLISPWRENEKRLNQEYNNSLIGLLSLYNIQWPTRGMSLYKQLQNPTHCYRKFAEYNSF
jgi:hypothetical protein